MNMCGVHFLSDLLFLENSSLLRYHYYHYYRYVSERKHDERLGGRMALWRLWWRVVATSTVNSSHITNTRKSSSSLS